MGTAFSYSTVFVTPAPNDQVLQAFLTHLNGTGATVTLAGPQTIIVTRRYTPTWAVVVGIIGLLFFLLGVLAFFVKETETVTIALSPDSAGTRVAISGMAAPHIVERLNYLVAWYSKPPVATTA